MGKDIYLEFETSSKVKYVTPKLVAKEGKFDYALLNGILQEDYFIIDVTFKDKENFVWKTFSKKIALTDAILGSEQLEIEYPDFVVNAQKEIDECKVIVEESKELVDEAKGLCDDLDIRVDALETQVDKNTGDISNINEELDTKVDKVEGKGLSSNDFTNEYKSSVDKNKQDISSLNTKVAKNTTDIGALNTNVAKNTTDVSNLNTKVDTKVDKIEGKGLSTNDFSNSYKQKVDKNVQDIASLSTKVDTNTTNISNLETDTNTKLDTKVDKVEGKGLSTNDYNNEEKEQNFYSYSEVNDFGRNYHNFLVETKFINDIPYEDYGWSPSDFQYSFIRAITGTLNSYTVELTAPLGWRTTALGLPVITGSYATVKEIVGNSIRQDELPEEDKEYYEKEKIINSSITGIGCYRMEAIVGYDDNGWISFYENIGGNDSGEIGKWEKVTTDYEPINIIKERIVKLSTPNQVYTGIEEAYGLTMYVDENQCLVINGTAKKDYKTNSMFPEGIPYSKINLYSGSSLTFFGDNDLITNGSLSVTVVGINNYAPGSTFAVFGGTNPFSPINTSTDDDSGIFGLTIPKGTTFNNFILKPMVVQDNIEAMNNYIAPVDTEYARVNEADTYTFTGEETWESIATNDSTKFRFKLTSTQLSDIVKPENNQTPGDILCANLPTVTEDETFALTEGISVDSEGNITIYKSDITTVEQAKTFMKDNQVRFKIIHYSIEPLPLTSDYWGDDGAGENSTSYIVFRGGEEEDPDGYVPPYTTTVEYLVEYTGGEVNNDETNN